MRFRHTAQTDGDAESVCLTLEVSSDTLKPFPLNVRRQSEKVEVGNRTSADWLVFGLYMLHLTFLVCFLTHGKDYELLT